MELTQRKERILYSVVSNYIDTGDPVGSKGIAEAIGVSSATVRNEMAELIELGLLEQPHTSAGRVPTLQGYRAYVDRLAGPAELPDGEKKYLDSFLLSSSYDPERLLSCVAKVSALYTKFASIITTPNNHMAKVKAVQFVQTSRRTAMLILLSSSGTMKNKVFHCDFDLTSEMLRMFFRLFNERVPGVLVSDITLPFVQTLGASFGELSILAGPALLALYEVAQATLETDIYISGQMNLLFYPELEHAGIRSIFNFFEDKEALSLLLTDGTKRLNVLIGNESNRHELINTSLVIAKYSVDGKETGEIAVLGPVRMDYSKIMATVSYLSIQVSTMLTMLMREE